ncbi:MAG: hypothetical protein ABSB63_19155 [Spirochaetia bacterium]
MVQELIDRGVKHLAVPVGDTAKGRALTRILALKTSPGWNVHGREVREWRFEGLTEKDGAPLLYGPHVAGQPLGEVLDLPLRSALPFLSRLAQALSLLAERRVPWFALQTDSVIFADTDGVLFLPPEVMREIRDLNSFAQSRDTFESINHPDLKGEALASFSIAALLYRISTGRFPFTGPDAEEIHEQARKLEIDAPAGIVPELDPELSALVMAGLGRSRRGAVPLAEWSDRLNAWQKRELFRVLPPGEKEKALREAESRQQASGKGFRRRMFWEKNWKIIGIVAIAVAVVAAGAGSILKNMLAPRITRGYTPQKVVETFYGSMNSLDHQAMQSCVIGRAGQGEINEVTMLYVTSKVTQGYQGKSTIISAADWDGRGRPKLESPSSLYGVTGLAVMQEQGEPAPVFKAQYDKWNPSQPSDTGSAAAQTAPKSEGHRVTDRVWLKQDKGDWVIYRIERLQQDPLPPPELAPAPAP